MMVELKTLLLQEPRWTVAAAESLTVGHVQAILGAVSGASEFFLGGVTAYTLDQKVKLLGVNRDLAAVCNSVSKEVAEQMAVGVAQLFGADWAVATTGYAEPWMEGNVSVPFAWFAVAQRLGEGRGFQLHAQEVSCPELDRLAAQSQISAAAVGGLLARVREARARG